jgi:hypothetical protein
MADCGACGLGRLRKCLHQRQQLYHFTKILNALGIGSAGTARQALRVTAPRSKCPCRRYGFPPDKLHRAGLVVVDRKCASPGRSVFPIYSHPRKDEYSAGSISSSVQFLLNSPWNLKFYITLCYLGRCIHACFIIVCTAGRAPKRPNRWARNRT